jgi:2-polyprenyl-6-methoxyphenol hydroxylase-like FAD-dependent oxidoreductase
LFFVSVQDDNTAWQRFLPLGPFALLPVRQGHHNIVWTTSPEAACELEKMGPKDFATAANKVTDAIVLLAYVMAYLEAVN